MEGGYDVVTFDEEGDGEIVRNLTPITKEHADRIADCWLYKIATWMLGWGWSGRDEALPWDEALRSREKEAIRRAEQHAREEAAVRRAREVAEEARKAAAEERAAKSREAQAIKDAMASFEIELVRRLIKTIKQRTTAQIKLIEAGPHSLDDLRNVARIGSQLVSRITSPSDQGGYAQAKPLQLAQCVTNRNRGIFPLLCELVTHVAMSDDHVTIDDAAPRAHGRPTKYKPEYAEEARAMCERGATNADLAIHFGVALSTIWIWQTSHKGFFESCKLGKEVADERVKQSFFMRATGYDYMAEKVTSFQGVSDVVEYREHVPPDTAAARFSLVNRCPDEFKENQLLEHSGAEDNPIRILAEQISGNAIRPRLPEPKVIGHEPSAIRPQQPQSVTSVTTNDDIEFEDTPVTRAPVVTRTVDDDDDRPREPRIHTISQSYRNDGDDV